MSSLWAGERFMIIHAGVKLKTGSRGCCQKKCCQTWIQGVLSRSRGCCQTGKCCQMDPGGAVKDPGGAVKLCQPSVKYCLLDPGLDPCLPVKGVSKKTLKIYKYLENTTTIWCSVKKLV